MPCTVAVHIGAGVHSVSRQNKYRDLIRRACRAGIRCEKALDAVVASGSVLEDSPLTNAGRTSNMTIDGTFESDAAVMTDIEGVMASVGAACDVAEPLRLAQILAQSKSANDLVAPRMVVGIGAKRLAQAQGLRVQDTSQNTDTDNVTDTIGVIALDESGCLAVGTSSGGPLNKLTGRVGAGALLGAGLWICKNEIHKTAVCMTGVGEDIIAKNMAHTIAENVLEFEDESVFIRDYFAKEVLDQPCQLGVPMIGVLTVKVLENGKMSVTFGHCTKSMVVGYGRNADAIEFEFSQTQRAGKSYVVGGAIV
ncbi:hypothetical protein CANCADRAFT_252 [Tortispora caseinolytica NRRL Y-17796]|uniref:Uncharacterized protein n=1 Tax=Tortispora caseinolytica NRRL Y-17796 TaxID=767744 RepID=A0A1E4TIV9_9ASCO|nr:hypothetical protein CANCADRAFT_252 [Tortispora caseinolytica NRRL Y-17796]